MADQIICPKCGNKNTPESKFCWICATSLAPEHETEEEKSDTIKAAEKALAKQASVEEDLGLKYETARRPGVIEGFFVFLARHLILVILVLGAGFGIFYGIDYFMAEKAKEKAKNVEGYIVLSDNVRIKRPSGFVIERKKWPYERYNFSSSDGNSRNFTLTLCQSAFNVRRYTAGRRRPTWTKTGIRGPARCARRLSGNYSDGIAKRQFNLSSLAANFSDAWISCGTRPVRRQSQLKATSLSAAILQCFIWTS